MRRCAVEIKPVLLRVFAVVPLTIGEAEDSLLQDGVALVPKREGKAELHFVVAESSDALLAPSVGARARLVVGQVVPCFPLEAHVLSDGSPLSFAEVGTPLLPGGFAAACFGEAVVLSRLSFHDRRLRDPSMRTSRSSCSFGQPRPSIRRS